MIAGGGGGTPPLPHPVRGNGLWSAASDPVARVDGVRRSEWRWDDHGGRPSAERGDSIVERWLHPCHLPWIVPAPHRVRGHGQWSRLAE